MAETGEGVPPAEEHGSEEESESSESEDSENVDMVDEEIFEVEQILSKKIEKGVTKYRVRWKGYTAADDSWEPVDNLGMVMDMVEEYEKEQEEKKKRRAEERRLLKLRMEGKRLPGEESPDSDEENSELFGLKDPFFKQLECGLIDPTQNGDLLTSIHLRKAVLASKKDKEEQDASVSGTPRSERKRTEKRTEQVTEKVQEGGRGGRGRGKSRGRGKGRGRARGRPPPGKKNKDDDSDVSSSGGSSPSQDSPSPRPAVKRRQTKVTKRTVRRPRISSSEESAGSYKLGDSDSSSSSDIVRKPPRGKRAIARGRRRLQDTSSSPPSGDSSAVGRRRRKRLDTASSSLTDDSAALEGARKIKRGVCDMDALRSSGVRTGMGESPKVSLDNLSLSDPGQGGSPVNIVASYQEVETSSSPRRPTDVCQDQEKGAGVSEDTTEVTAEADEKKVVPVTIKSSQPAKSQVSQAGKKKTKSRKRKGDDTVALHSEAVSSGQASPPKMSPSQSASSPAQDSPAHTEVPELSLVVSEVTQHSRVPTDAVPHSPPHREVTHRSLAHRGVRRKSGESNDMNSAVDESSQEAKLTIDLSAGGSESEDTVLPDITPLSTRKRSQEKRVPPLKITLMKLHGCESAPSVTKQKQSVQHVSPAVPSSVSASALEAGRSDSKQAKPVAAAVPSKTSTGLSVKREPLFLAVTASEEKRRVSPVEEKHRPGVADIMQKLSATASSGKDLISKTDPIKDISQPAPNRGSPITASVMDISPSAFATNLYNMAPRRESSSSGVGSSAAPARNISSRDSSNQGSSAGSVKDIPSISAGFVSPSLSASSAINTDAALSASAYRGDSGLFSRFDMKSVAPVVKQAVSSVVGAALGKDAVEKQTSIRPGTSLPKKKDMDMIFAGDTERASKLRGLDSDFELALERMDLTDIENMLLPPVEPIEISDDALKRAVLEGNQTLVERALAALKQYDVNMADANGCTLLMHAVLNGYDDIMLQLMIHGADVQVQQKNGVTALMLAVDHAECSTVALLLEMGANINMKDSNGETALIKAVKRGDKQILKLLLENGSNFTAATNAGYNAIQLAKVHRLADMETTLIDHITRVTAEFEKQVRATLRNTATLISPLFPHQCFPLYESDVNTVQFRYHPTAPAGPGMGFLLFIAHARITGSEVKCRLYGHCAVNSVTLNGVQQPSLTEESNFVLMCHPLFEGDNELVIKTVRDTTSKAKLIVCAYKAQLITSDR